MIQFTFCNNNAEPQTAYLQRIVLGKSYPMPSKEELDMLSTKVFQFFDKEGGISQGELLYTTVHVGSYVVYKQMGSVNNTFLFKEGDEVFIVKKDLMGDTAYLVPSREVFKQRFGVEVPSLLCSFVWIKEKDNDNDSLHLYVDEEYVLTLLGRHSRQLNVTTMKKYRKDILEKLRNEFWLMDNVPRTNPIHPQEDAVVLSPILKDNFLIVNKAQEERVVMDNVPPLTCPYIRWKFKENEQFFLLAELDGIEPPIKGVRSFEGNGLYFEQLVNWYYTLALME